MTSKEKVLFLCKNNSARSQMAEGLLKTLYRESYDVCSAGSNPTKLNPYAVKVMGEIGIDIAAYRSKSLQEFQNIEFDYVVTVCDDKGGACPIFPGKMLIHQSFEDPASFNGSDEEKTIVFRRIRDELKEWIEETFKKK